MKKILVIAPYTFLPARSGGQKLIAQFVENLAKQAQVTVVSTTQESGFTAPADYRLLPLLADSFFRYADFTLIATLTDLIERNHYDWIIWEHPYYGWLADQLKRRTGINTLIHTHNIEFERFRSLGKIWWPLLKHYEKYAFSVADKIGFITPEDRNVAVQRLGVAGDRCIDIPYGVNAQHYPLDRGDCQQLLRQRHGIDSDHKILLFTGALDYLPNYRALTSLLKEVLPRLRQHTSLCFTLLVCGKGLPKKDNELAAYKKDGVVYAGFVADIDLYCKGADLLLNPVIEGGGIKTKMIEAIALGTPVIAMRSAARGLDPSRAGSLLYTVGDSDWSAFCNQIVTEATMPSAAVTSDAFYDYYGWDLIISRLLRSLNQRSASPPVA